jgi:hypothetical protein
MPRISWLWALWPWLWALPAQGQDLAALLAQGVEAHRQYNLLTSDSLLAEVLAHKDQLTRLQHGEALYFYSRNMLRMATDQGSEEGFANPLVQSRMFTAYAGFAELEKSGIPRWGDKGKPEQLNMVDALIKAAVGTLETIVANPAHINRYETLAQAYISLAATISPQLYTPHELMGQLHLMAQRPVPARESFEKAIDLHRQKRVLAIDNIRIPTAYHALASLVLESDPARAHALAKRGYLINELEWNTLQVNAAKIGPQLIEEHKAIYYHNRYSLGLLELELCPAYVPADTALALYGQRSTHYQDNAYFLYNYGQLLITINPRLAAEQFEKSLDLDTNFFESYYALGNLYLDLGNHYAGLALEEQLENGENALRASGLRSTGYTYLRKALTVNPGHRGTMVRLLGAAQVLGKAQAVERYTQMLND